MRQMRLNLRIDPKKHAFLLLGCYCVLRVMLVVALLMVRYFKKRRVFKNVKFIALDKKMCSMNIILGHLTLYREVIVLILSRYASLSGLIRLTVFSSPVGS